ncbi:hypothetical protein BDZ89DRAFT_420979 [Hymenopellis radicata]|nr:hypothetical protein BDZ89DRAFT_420979 [Hymenopellis radicata]
MSSCEFAVDVDGFKARRLKRANLSLEAVEEVCTPHLLKRAHLSQQQLEAIHSLEEICQRLSSTDLGSLEESTSFNSFSLLSISRAISSTSFAVPLSPSPSPKRTTTPTGLEPSKHIASSPCSAEPFKPLRIRAPISLDVSPRKSRHPCPSPRKPLSPQSIPSNQNRSLAKSRPISPRASPQSSKQSTVTAPRKYILTPPTTLKRAIKRKPAPPLLTTSPLKEKRVLSTGDTFSSNQSRQVDASPARAFERQSLYKPTLSSSMKGTPKGGKVVKRAVVKRKSLTKVF